MTRKAVKKGVTKGLFCESCRIYLPIGLTMRRHNTFVHKPRRGASCGIIKFKFTTPKERFQQIEQITAIVVDESPSLSFETEAGRSIFYCYECKLDLKNGNDYMKHLIDDDRKRAEKFRIRKNKKAKQKRKKG